MWFFEKKIIRGFNTSALMRTTHKSRQDHGYVSMFALQLEEVHEHQVENLLDFR